MITNDFIENAIAEHALNFITSNMGDFTESPIDIIRQGIVKTGMYQFRCKVYYPKEGTYIYKKKISSGGGKCYGIESASVKELPDSYEIFYELQDLDVIYIFENLWKL